MSTAAPSANGQVTDMKKVLDDQRAAEVAGRNLYQTFKASTVGMVRKGAGWFGDALERTGIKRFFGRVWGFVSPYLSKAAGVARRIGILPSLAYGVTTYRGRHYLLTVIPERAYRIASFPFRFIARGITAVLDRLGYGQYADAMAARWTAVELWVLDQHKKVLGWFDDNHSSWAMRAARNGLFAVVGLRAIALIPFLPLKVVALIALALFPTSEVRESDNEIYPDSIGYLAFDTVMALFSRSIGATDAASVTTAASRSPKPSDLARQVGEKAKAEALAAGANRIEARRIGQFARQAYMDEHGTATPVPPASVPATA